MDIFCDPQHWRLHSSCLESITFSRFPVLSVYNYLFSKKNILGSSYVGGSMQRIILESHGTLQSQSRHDWFCNTARQTISIAASRECPRHRQVRKGSRNVKIEAVYIIASNSSFSDFFCIHPYIPNSPSASASFLSPAHHPLSFKQQKHT